MLNRPRFKVKLFYNDRAPPPNAAGDLAVYTWNTDVVSKDMEVNAGLSRADIGTILVMDMDAEGVNSGWKPHDYVPAVLTT